MRSLLIPRSSARAFPANGRVLPRTRLLVAGAATLFLLGLAGCGRSGPAESEALEELPSSAGLEAAAAAGWPGYNRDLAGTRFSPLTQIHTGNVAGLVPAWRYPLGRTATTGALGGAAEGTPIVVGGLMYVIAADRVVALDPGTGAEVWRHVLDDGAPSGRGLAYWDSPETGAARIFFTRGNRLVALDAATGAKARAFGIGGEIAMPVPYDGVPTRFDDLIVVGSSGAPGGVRAYRAASGEEVWSFPSVPAPGEPGSGTWESGLPDAESNPRHGAVSMTVDVDRELLFAVFDSPGSDRYYGGDRPGDNLFGDSIVALDVRTGQRRWHFQTVHHDLWDYGLPAPPVLVDVGPGGRYVPLLAQPGKTGYLYVLNRETGQPFFDIEERAVPGSDVPEERASGTQPIPIKPPPIARVDYADSDLVAAADTNEAHAASCAQLVERSGGLENRGPFSPYRYRKPESEPRSTIVFPGSFGGANWGGAAADPELGLVYVNTTSQGSIGWIEQVETEDGFGYRRSSAAGGPLGDFRANRAAADSQGGDLAGSELDWPCQKPPWGELVAVDAAAGEVAWRVPLGITPELPAEKRHTGRFNMGGPMVTAGGLVFIAATSDRRFRAFDSSTGEELWSAELPLSGHAVPVTYLDGAGRQLVAITAAGAPAIDDPDSSDGVPALVVFALPREGG